jgi:hypothetical protein
VASYATRPLGSPTAASERVRGVKRPIEGETEQRLPPQLRREAA